MQFDYRNIDSPDDFSNQVAEKLQEHRLTVDPHVWELLQEKLPPAKRTPSFVWWGMGAAVAAAAVIGLLFLIGPSSQSHSQENKMVAGQSVPHTHSTSKPIAGDEPRETEKNTVYTQKRAQSTPVKPEIKRGVENKPSLIAAYLHRRLKEKPSTETAARSASKKETAPTPDTLIPEKQTVEPSVATSGEKPEPEKKPKKETMLIARLGGGAGNTGPAFTGRRDALYVDLPIGTEVGSGGTEGYNALTPSDYSEIQHLPPVSVSVMAEFPLNRTWSIETGLMYSYLSSRYEKNDETIYTGTLHLHYLGLPVNLKMNLYQNPSWRIYALAGGAIEKGIGSVYKQTIRYQNGTNQHLIKRSSIKGLQYSSHVAAGFDYKINQHIRLFGEPYVIYYFNNNQPMSARTENPLTFGLNTGIRVQF